MTERSPVANSLSTGLLHNRHTEVLEAFEPFNDGEDVMAQLHGLSSHEFAGEVPPGRDPSFGHLPDSPFEHLPERLVLSHEEHSHLALRPGFAALGGEFESERFGRASLVVRETGAPGEVRIQADVCGPTGPTIHLDARVRESWLARTVASGDLSHAPARVVGVLFELAEMPRQSTVKVRVEAD